MSTRIYNAYRYGGTDGGNVHDLFKWLHQFRAKFKKHIIAQMKATFLPTAKYNDIVRMIETDTRSGLNLPLNIAASVVVYFASWRGENFTIVQFFGLDRDFKWRVPKFFRDFHYQNQADRDEDAVTGEEISEKEWKYREKVWDVVFKDSDNPSEAGLIFQLNLYMLAHEIAREIKGFV